MSDSPREPTQELGRILAAHQELLGRLYIASELFRNEGDGALEGAKQACIAVARFLYVSGESGNMGAPFLALAQSFGDLEKGISPELFSTKSTPKERPRSSQARHVRLTASVLMEALMGLGDSETVAAATVARQVSAWPWAARMKITSTTVVNWRKKIRSSDPTSPFGRMVSDLLSSEDPPPQD